MKKNSNNWPDVKVLSSREELGRVAGEEIENKIVELLASKQEIRMIFAAAPSQNETLEYLVQSKRIEWNRIVGFNLDEYIGLGEGAPQLFASYLNEKLFNRVRFKNVFLLNGSGNIQEELSRYETLLSQAPVDIVCLGIGENGHIAFNDPSIADFEDPLVVKLVKLDMESRLQQVHDGCFEKLSDVPTKALTLTIPTIMNADALFCMVPGSNKKEAVFHTLNSSITREWPATILRNHPDCKFYFDEESISFNQVKQL